MRPLTAQDSITWAAQTRERKDVATCAAKDKECLCAYAEDSFKLLDSRICKNIATVSNGVTKICILKASMTTGCTPAKLSEAKLRREIEDDIDISLSNNSQNMP